MPQNNEQCDAKQYFHEVKVMLGNNGLDKKHMILIYFLTATPTIYWDLLHLVNLLDINLVVCQNLHERIIQHVYHVYIDSHYFSLIV